MDACPPLEDIAAFIDGKTLSPEERAHITEHLARCESCYEIFAGAVDFQSSAGDGIDGGDVIPFPLPEERHQEKHVRAVPARMPRRVSRWLPLAASVALVSALGFMISQRSRALPDITVAGVVEPLQGKDGIVDELYQPEVERGLPDAAPFMTPDTPAFLAGVYLVDLRLSVRAREVAMTRDLLGFVSGELEQMELFVEPKTAAFFKERADQIADDPAILSLLAQELPQKESALQNELAEEPFFRFGTWTEAGRVSAKVRSPKFFEQRANRRFLALIPREIRPEQEPRYEPILDSLQKIEILWERSPRDYEALASHFENIIRRVEQIQREDQEDLNPLSAP